MRAFKRSRIVIPLISFAAVFALSAQAQEPNKPPAKQGQAKRAPAVRQAAPAQAGQVRGPQQGPRVVRGRMPERNFGGHAYHGRLAWEGGRWRHEAHNGRYGWGGGGGGGWDVGAFWYFYRQARDGPPAYVSDVEVMDDYAGQDDGLDGPPVAAGY